MLINCKECGKEVSDTAKLCPHCGAKVKKEKVVMEKPQRSNPFKKLVEGATSTAKGKWIYLGTVIGSGAIALIFLILTILSFATPYAFLHSELCKDSYDLIGELGIKADESYQIDIAGETYKITSYRIDGKIAVIVNPSGLSGVVHYRFAKGGRVYAIVRFDGNEADYVFEDTNPVVVELYGAAFFESSAAHDMARTYLELSETVLDIVLLTNGKSYDFEDILSDYADYHDSLLGIRVSSTVLAVLFTAVSVCGIVFYLMYGKNRAQTTEPLQEEASEVPQE